MKYYFTSEKLLFQLWILIQQWRSGKLEVVEATGNRINSMFLDSKNPQGVGLPGDVRSTFQGIIRSNFQ